jgi:hypothetical protein
LPSPPITALPPGARVLLLGRFARGGRDTLTQCLCDRGFVLERQISPATALVIVGAAGWPLKRNGRLPRDLLIAQALQTQSGRPVIVGEQELDSSPRRSGRSRFGGAPRRALRHADPIDGTGPECISFSAASRHQDLVRLLSAGVPMKRLRRALGQLTRWFPDAVAEANRSFQLHPAGLAVQDESGRLKTPSGQRLFPFSFGVPESASTSWAMERFRSPGLESNPIFPLRLATPVGILPRTVDLFAAAVAQEQAGQLCQAEFTYRKLLRAEGPDADVCFNLANVLAAGRRFDAAVERLLIAVELRPRFVEAWYNLGLLAQHTGQQTLARSSLQSALDLAPEFEAAREALAGTSSAT